MGIEQVIRRWTREKVSALSHGKRDWTAILFRLDVQLELRARNRKSKVWTYGYKMRSYHR
jgi:hypothetical protein